MTIEQLQQQAFSITKDLFIRRVGNITKPIEFYENGWFEVQFPLILKLKGIPVTIYSHIDFFNISGRIAITAMLGFRTAYNEEKWEKNKVIETTLFNCCIDEIYNEVDFSYKGTNETKAKNGVIALTCENFTQTLDRFYTEVIYNLNGPYLSIIESIN